MGRLLQMAKEGTPERNWCLDALVLLWSDAAPVFDAVEGWVEERRKGREKEDLEGIKQFLSEMGRSWPSVAEREEAKEGGRTNVPCLGGVVGECNGAQEI